MIAILFLFLVSMIPVAGVWFCIQVFRWLLRRSTGADVLITPDSYFEMYRNMKTVWHHAPLDYSAEGQGERRKSKHNPHFERLIEKERAERLALAQSNITEPNNHEDTQDPVPLASLVRKKTLD